MNAVGWTLFAILLAGSPGSGDAASPPAVTIQLGRPRTQVERVLQLFQPPQAPSPAVALANWKRATKGTKSLSKGAEAALAALNPAMAKELDVLAGAEFVLDFAADGGTPSWSFVVPKDDGTFASFATSMALTDGAGETALGKASVDRLSKTAGPLMAREDDLVVLANNREMLARGLATSQHANRGRPENPMPTLRVTAAGLARSSNLQVRRFAELLRCLGASEYQGNVNIVGNEVLTKAFCQSSWADSTSRLDPKWLEEIPATASLVFAIALDPTPQGLDRVFDLLDKLEKVDPALAPRAPVRSRIGIFCRVAGLDVEADLWPKLQGVSGFLSGDIHSPKAVAIEFHTIDEASAARLRDRVFPKLARSLGIEPSSAKDTKNAKVLGNVRGQPVWISTKGSRTVRLIWRTENLAAEAAAEPPHRFLDSLTAADLASLQTAQRAGWLWPSRLGLLEQDATVKLAVDQADSIRWLGRQRDHQIEDTISLNGLDRVVRRFLELTPQEPAPAGRK